MLEHGKPGHDVLRYRPLAYSFSQKMKSLFQEIVNLSSQAGDSK